MQPNVLTSCKLQIVYQLDRITFHFSLLRVFSCSLVKNRYLYQYTIYTSQPTNNGKSHERQTTTKRNHPEKIIPKG